MPALTPEQEMLKQAALALSAGDSLSNNDYSRAQDQYENLATPAAILAILAQLEAAQEAPSEPVKPPMTYEQFMDEAKRTGLTAGDLIPGVVVRLAEMEAQGVIRKHEDGGHEYVAAPGEPGQ